MRVDPETYDEFNKTLSAENPDVVFGLWPLEYCPASAENGEFSR